MSDHYVLVGHTPVKADLMVWARWFESAERHVDDTKIGPTRVSTVFLGLDHSFGDGPPLLFETLVFGSALDGEMHRYSTWDEARAGHAAMVKRVQQPAEAR